MLDGHKIVCVTPAGRRHTMRLLVPYVLSCGIVDRFEIWINTRNETDLAFINYLAHPR